MNLFFLIGRMKGIPIGDASRTLTSVRTLVGDSFLQHQERAKWSILNHHQQNTSWYTKVTGQDKLTAWEEVPILTKDHFQRAHDTLMSHGYSSKNAYLNNTSGSTGKPFHFAKDKFCHAMTWAYIISCYEKLGLIYGKSLQARFFGIPLTKKGYWKERLKDFFSSRVRFPVFDLSDDVLRAYLSRFRNAKFEYVYGYTSSLVLFAEYVIRQNVVLKQLCPSLKWCIVTSEVCSPQDRNVLERAFGVKVVNEYGAAELDIVAFEDKDGDWLLNEENLYIEIIGEDGKPVKDGQPGQIVVTSLYNKAMPFIRYNLGDIVSLHPGRKGIHRCIKTMEGRTNDVATLPSGKKSPGLTFYYISKSLLEKGGFLKEFTIKQIAPDHFHFEYVASDIINAEQQAQIAKMMDLYLEPGLKATFERREKIERTGAGKFKHFQRFVK